MLISLMRWQHMNVYITQRPSKMPVTTEQSGQNMEAVQRSLQLIAAVHSPCAGRLGLMLFHLALRTTCRTRAAVAKECSAANLLLAAAAVCPAVPAVQTSNTDSSPCDPWLALG